MEHGSKRLGVGTAIAAVWLGCTPNGSPSSSPVTEEPSRSTTSAAAPSAPPPLALAISATASAVPSASAASPTFDARAAKYPLRWSPELKLDNIGAVAAAMNEKMRNGTVVEMSREGSSAPPERRSATTCAEYEKAIADGFDAQTTYDRSMESFFLARCTPLRFLSTARPSLTSYVSGLRMDRDPLGLLPASMSIQMESPSDEQKDAIAHGQRLKAYEPRLVVKSARATSLTFADPESKIDSQVDVAAFGDFDHDGIEDVLLFQSFHALEGSLRGYWHVIVTRKGPHEPLMTLQKIERGTSASP